MQNTLSVIHIHEAETPDSETLYRISADRHVLSQVDAQSIFLTKERPHAKGNSQLRRVPGGFGKGLPGLWFFVIQPLLPRMRGSRTAQPAAKHLPPGQRGATMLSNGRPTSSPKGSLERAARAAFSSEPTQELPLLAKDLTQDLTQSTRESTPCI